jgi:hypothetical protein
MMKMPVIELCIIAKPEIKPSKQFSAAAKYTDTRNSDEWTACNQPEV